MMNFVYSANNNMFYPYEYKTQYDATGDWPVDGIDVSDDIYQLFTGKRPDGKMRVAGSDGMPAWADIPPPSHDDLIAYAEREKSQRLTSANAVIAPLQDAADLEMATTDEQMLLLAWKKYRVLLNRADTSTAPDIEWPTPPGQPAS